MSLESSLIFSCMLMPGAVQLYMIYIDIYTCRRPSPCCRWLGLGQVLTMEWSHQKLVIPDPAFPIVLRTSSWAQSCKNAPFCYCSSASYWQQLSLQRLSMACNVVLHIEHCTMHCLHQGDKSTLHAIFSSRITSVVTSTSCLRECPAVPPTCCLITKPFHEVRACCSRMTLSSATSLLAC